MWFGGNSAVRFLVSLLLISLQPCSLSACWSVWHGYLPSSDIGRRDGWGGTGLKVTQEAFRPLCLLANTLWNSQASWEVGLELREGPGGRLPSTRETSSWQDGGVAPVAMETRASRHFVSFSQSLCLHCRLCHGSMSSPR